MFLFILYSNTLLTTATFDLSFFAPFFSERRIYLAEVVNNLDAHLLCLQGSFTTNFNDRYIYSYRPANREQRSSWPCRWSDLSDIWQFLVKKKDFSTTCIRALKIRGGSFLAILQMYNPFTKKDLFYFGGNSSVLLLSNFPLHNVETIEIKSDEDISYDALQGDLLFNNSTLRVVCTAKMDDQIVKATLKSKEAIILGSLNIDPGSSSYRKIVKYFDDYYAQVVGKCNYCEHDKVGSYIFTKGLQASKVDRRVLDDVFINNKKVAISKNFPTIVQLIFKEERKEKKGEGK